MPSRAIAKRRSVRRETYRHPRHDHRGRRRHQYRPPRETDGSCRGIGGAVRAQTGDAQVQELQERDE